MLHITKNTESTIYFTGTEQALITDPYFLFVFTNRATGDEVKVVVTNTSTSENRYDKGVVDGAVFNTFDTGLWVYDCYEQASSSSTTTSGKNKVESGYMYLHDVGTEPTKYSGQDNTFKTYE